MDSHTAWALWAQHAPDAAKVALDAALLRLSGGDPSPGLHWAVPTHLHQHAPLGVGLIVFPPSWMEIVRRRGDIEPRDTPVPHLDRDWVPSFHPSDAPLGDTGCRWHLPHRILPVCPWERGMRILGYWSLLLGRPLRFPSALQQFRLTGVAPVARDGDIGAPSASHTQWVPCGTGVLPARFWGASRVCQVAGNAVPILFPHTHAAEAAVFPLYDPRDSSPLFPHVCTSEGNTAFLAEAANRRLPPTYLPYAMRVARLSASLTRPVDLTLLQRCPGCWLTVADALEKHGLTP